MLAIFSSNMLIPPFLMEVMSRISSDDKYSAPVGHLSHYWTRRSTDSEPETTRVLEKRWWMGTFGEYAPWDLPSAQWLLQYDLSPSGVTRWCKESVYNYLKERGDDSLIPKTFTVKNLNNIGANSSPHVSWWQGECSETARFYCRWIW